MVPVASRRCFSQPEVAPDSLEKLFGFHAQVSSISNGEKEETKEKTTNQQKANGKPMDFEEQVRPNENRQNQILGDVVKSAVFRKVGPAQHLHGFIKS